MNEVLAPFMVETEVDDEKITHVDEDRLGEAIQAIHDEINSNATLVAQHGLKPEEMLEILTGHVTSTLILLAQQLADQAAAITKQRNTLLAMAGSERTDMESPQAAGQAVIESLVPAFEFDRMSRVYTTVYEKARPKLDVVR